jgi:hypothetical protein
MDRVQLAVAALSENFARRTAVCVKVVGEAF